MHIFFIGYMGSGKSTLGKRVARRLSIPFVDTDKEIEKKYNLSIPDIFQSMGENKFREMEEEVLHEVIARAPHLIAVGGGTPCFNNNMKTMKAHGLTLYLNRPFGELANRIENSKKSRPMVDHLKGEKLKAFIEEHLTEREQFYLQSEIIIPRDEQSTKRLTELILNYRSDVEK